MPENCQHELKFWAIWNAYYCLKCHGSWGPGQGIPCDDPKKIKLDLKEDNARTRQL